MLLHHIPYTEPSSRNASYQLWLCELHLHIWISNAQPWFKKEILHEQVTNTCKHRPVLQIPQYSSTPIIIHDQITSRTNFKNIQLRLVKELEIPVLTFPVRQSPRDNVFIPLGRKEALQCRENSSSALKHKRLTTFAIGDNLERTSYRWQQLTGQGRMEVNGATKKL